MLFLHHIDETNIVDGNLLTIFDYYSYYVSQDVDAEIILFIPSTSFVDIDIINTVISRYKNTPKYTIIDEHSIFNILKSKHHNCFLSDRTFYEIYYSWNKPVVLSKFKLHVYRTWFSFNHKLNLDNIHVLNEVSELGIVNYKRKIYFEGLQNYSNPCVALLLANGQRQISISDIENILTMYSHLELQIITNIDIEYTNPRVTFYNTVKKDLFNFSTFIYTANDFDYAPRMLLESIYLNKEIIIYKMPKIPSKRFKVLQNRSLLKDYTFSKDDIFEEQIESYIHELI